MSAERRFNPGRRDFVRRRDFLAASAAPPRASVAAAFGLADAHAGDVNPQEAEAAGDPIADFLFVRREPDAKQRSVAAHVGNVTFSTAFEMVSIVLPFLNKAVGGDVTTFSHLRAGSSILNCLGGVCVGTLTDRIGAKYGLLISHASAAASFCIVGASSSLTSLYSSALPLLFMHPFQTTMTVASLNSDKETRARALGRVGALYGLGFFAGSAIVVGALHIAKPRHIAFAAAGMQIAVTAWIALSYGDASQDMVGREEEGGNDSEQASLPPLQVLKRPGVASVLAFKLVLVGTAGAVTAMTQQFAMQPFGFSEREVAMLMAYIGGLQIFSQSFVSDDLVPQQLYIGTGVCVGGSLLAMAALTSTKIEYLLMLAPVTLSFHASNTMLGSLLTLCVPQEEMGTVLGLSVATMPAGQTFAYLAAAKLYATFGFSAVPLSAAVALTSATGLFYLAGYMPRSELEVQPGQDDE